MVFKWIKIKVILETTLDLCLKNKKIKMEKNDDAQTRKTKPCGVLHHFFISSHVPPICFNIIRKHTDFRKRTHANKKGMQLVFQMYYCLQIIFLCIITPSSYFYT